MVFWFVAIAILIASLAVLALLPKPGLEDRKPASLGDFQFPTVSEARVLTVIRGTVKQAGINFLDVGDFKTEPVYKKVSNPATFGLTKKKVKTGDRYHVGAIIGICLGSGYVDYPVRLKKILIDEKEAWSGDITSGSFSIDKPLLHGGDDKRGGYAAFLDYYPGVFPQGPNAYWENTITSGPSTAYNGQVILIQRGPSAGRVGLVLNTPLQYAFSGNLIASRTTSGYFSNSEVVPPMAMVVECCPGIIGDTNKAKVNDGDYNLANFFYEYLTNKDWGLGEPSGRINTAAFVTAQNTFFIEGVGVSVQIESQRKIRDFIADLERIADAKLFFNHATGLWDLKLIRNDYIRSELSLFDENNVIEWLRWERNAPVETVNQIITRYVDKADFKEKTADAKDLAGRYNQDYQIPSTISFWGLSYGPLAYNLAFRETRHLALPLARGSFLVNRQAISLGLGSAFRLARMSQGFPEIVARVLEWRDSPLKDGTIEISWVEDVFSVSGAAFTVPNIGGGSSLATNPADVVDFVFEEQPYFLSGHAVRVHAFGKQPNGSATTFDLWISENSGTTYTIKETQTDFCPTASVTANYPATTGPVDASSLVVTDLANLANIYEVSTQDIEKGFNLFRWETGEICACESVSWIGTNQYRLNNVWRGLLDTTPQPHSAGEKLYFFSQASAIPEAVFGVNQTLNAKLIMLSFLGFSLDINVATVKSITTKGRFARPLAPGNIRVNGTANAVSIPAAGTNITIDWSTRNRINQTTILKQDAASVAHEAGTTYTIAVYGSSGTLLAIYDNLTGESWIHTTSLQTTDGSAAQSALIYVLYAVRNGINSQYPQVMRVARPSGSVPTITPSYTLTGTPEAPAAPGTANVIGSTPVSGTPSSTNSTLSFDPTTGQLTYQAGVVFKGDWNSGTTYQPNQTVRYSSSTWIAKTTNINKQPDINPSDWSAF